MISIAIDGRSLLEKKWGGVSWYAAEMIHAIFYSDKKNDHTIRIGISGRDHNAFSNIQRSSPYFIPQKAITHTRIPNSLLNLLTLTCNAPHIDTLAFRQHQPDITWLPNWNIASIASPYILTVHDLSYIHYSRAYSLKERLWHRAVNIQRMIANAHHIIAVSAFTAHDIMKTYAIPESRITVIHEGVGKRFFHVPSDNEKKHIQKKYALPERFILGFSGNARKNMPLLHAIMPHLPVPLVVVGSHHLRFIEEPDKPIVYALAECLLYPSLFEGFGLPILEAMASGTPVIASNVTSIPEVVGDAGLLISPYRPEQWILAIHELFHDHDLHHDYILKGRNRAQEFSWEKAADAWWKCIEKGVY